MNEWITWGGGRCPVAKGTLVDVRYRDNETKFSIPALHTEDGRDASGQFWVNDNQENDIVAYRLSEKAEKTEENEWIEWKGGDCPVPKDTMVNVRMRSGQIFTNQPALRDGNELYVAARFWHHEMWGSEKHPMDIMAYQLCDEQPKADLDDWIEWKGGECPVLKGTLVNVKYRNGEIRENLSALSNAESASKSYWHHDRMNFDIVAYQLVVAPKPETTKITQRVLTQEGLDLQEEYESLYGGRGCSCSTSIPPCNSCTHPGNPIAISETEEYWTTVEVDELLKPSEPVDVIWGSW